MANKNNLSDEWKDTVYNLGGAFVGLGKTVIKSVKVGVDAAYDFINEENDTQKKSNKSTVININDDLDD